MAREWSGQKGYRKGWAAQNNVSAGSSGITASKSVLFDGTDEWIDVGSTIHDFDYDDAMSAMVWIKVTLGTQGRIMGRVRSSPNYYGWGTRVQTDGTITMDVAHNSAGRNLVDTDAAVADGGWHCIVVMNNGNGDASGLSIAVDGSVVATTAVVDTLSSTITGQTIDFGFASTNNQSDFLAANLLFGAVWNGVLSAGELTSLYNSGTAKDPTTVSTSATLLNFWPLGESPDHHSNAGGFGDRQGTDDGTGVNLESGDIEADVP